MPTPIATLTTGAHFESCSSEEEDETDLKVIFTIKNDIGIAEITKGIKITEEFEGINTTGSGEGADEEFTFGAQHDVELNKLCAC